MTLAREAIRSGSIGAVQRIVATLGGPRAMMFRNGTHLVDGVCFFADSEPEWVFGELEPGYDHYDRYLGDGGRDPATDPAVSGYVHFRNGVRAFVNVNKSQFAASFTFQVYGETGMLDVHNSRVIRRDRNNFRIPSFRIPLVYQDSSLRCRSDRCNRKRQRSAQPGERSQEDGRDSGRLPPIPCARQRARRSAAATGVLRSMRAVPDEKKFVIADQNSYAADLISPNPRGWYHSVANVVATPLGLVAVYRLSDSHSAVCTHIMVAYSSDGGRTWHGHRSISRRNVWEHQSVWIAPQLSRLRDGRLVIICDRGHRTSGDDWPRLAFWQRPPRGMANFLFWSDDHGGTWGEPVQCDDVGGEPGYIVDLLDGTLVYTRTEPVETDVFESPPPPGHNIYHRNTAVFSDDRGRTWNRTATVSDDPFHGDSEVGIVELEPGHLLARHPPESASETAFTASPAA